MEIQKSSNTLWHHAIVNYQHHEQQNGYRSAILWLTGPFGVVNRLLLMPSKLASIIWEVAHF